jgi:DNA-binding transcriptional ArsR family regulator
MPPRPWPRRRPRRLRRARLSSRAAASAPAAQAAHGQRLEAKSGSQLAGTFLSVTDLDALATALSAFGHPTRLRIAVLLSGEIMSPVQATPRIEQVTLGKVSHHFRVLHAAGLIRQTSTRQRRGAVEHFYMLTDDAQELLADLGLVQAGNKSDDHPQRPYRRA